MNDTIFHVGTSGYSYKEWNGSFYPEKFSAKKMLAFYAERFGTVEMNNTFLRMPKPADALRWAAEAPADFLFVLKSPQRITHFQRLKDSNETLKAFLDAAAELKTRLGPLLFQLPPNFKKDVPRLGKFLSLIPKRYRAALEFRHPSWFDEEVFDLLRRHKAALCLAEAEDGVETPILSTADWGYLRLRLPEYTDAALRKWIKQMRQQNWREAFIFFKHEEEGKGPKFAERFLRLVKKSS